MCVCVYLCVFFYKAYQLILLHIIHHPCHRLFNIYKYQHHLLGASWMCQELYVSAKQRSPRFTDQESDLVATALAVPPPLVSEVWAGKPSRDTSRGLPCPWGTLENERPTNQGWAADRTGRIALPRDGLSSVGAQPQGSILESHWAIFFSPFEIFFLN